MPHNDATLLEQYVERRSEDAFRELVERHLPLVLAAARRVTCGDEALATDAAQQVFVDLARQAGKLPRRVVLAGWLHRHAYFTACKAVRAEVRRRRRELESFFPNENTMLSDDPSPENWNRLEPEIDRALQALSAKDRDAVLLRYFQSGTLREVAAALGVSEGAAQKRVSRALAKMRGWLARRGVALAPAILTALLADHAPAAAAPGRLAAKVSRAALARSMEKAAVAQMASWKAAMLGAGLSVCLGGGLWGWQTASNRRLEGELARVQGSDPGGGEISAPASRLASARPSAKRSAVEIMEEMRRLSQLPQITGTAEQIAALLAQATEADLPGIAGELAKPPFTERFWTFAIPAVLDRWAVADARAALDYVAKHLGDTNYGNEKADRVLKRWRQCDVATAREWFAAWVKGRSEKEDLLAQIFGGWIAAKDPANFSSFLHGLAEIPGLGQEFRGEVRRRALDCLTWDKSVEPESQIGQLTDPEARAHVARNALIPFFRETKDLTPEGYRRAEWALSVVAPEHRSQITELVAGVAGTRPEGKEWLRAHLEAKDYDEAMLQAARSWDESETALALASEVSDTTQRDLLTAGIFRKWVRGDRAEAERFLRSSGWPETRLRRLREILAEPQP